MTLINKILGGASALLLIICLIGYSVILNKNNEIITLENKNKELVSEVMVLEDRVEVCQKICKAESSAKEHQQKEITTLREKEEIYLTQIDSLLGKGTQQEEINEQNIIKDSKAAYNTPLPNDLIRLLGKHCESVRGSACPNP